MPKYDLVVAANNAYSAGVARRASVLDSAIDWPLVYNELVAITPAGAKVQSFDGASTTSSGSSTSAGATTTSTSTGSSSTSAATATSRRPSGRSQLSVTGPGPNLTISEAWINAISGSQLLRQSAAGGDDGQSGLDHLVPLHHLDHTQREPLQECEPEMNEVREYRIPLMIAAGSLVVALLLWAVLVSPQNSKLSSLQAQETQLQSQQTQLQAKLASLQSEQQKLSSSCADLQKIATQIPSVQSPTDVDAEESSFESQFNALTATSGVTLTQFSGFAPATTAQATPATGAAPATPTRASSPCRPRWP